MHVVLLEAIDGREHVLDSGGLICRDSPWPDQQESGCRGRLSEVQV